ncbi:hypothetical protein LL912_11635 [Niabella sp. CC-SYL272]|uniref:hypothetical protein n=1 Tax=Niabella agricola TaxID=2891571 RepID=UPI001F26BB5B|nr:hypothetical protein [Niabella agricola]MCF3109427.1 hypothetical protein [Niabella agricola]
MEIADICYLDGSKIQVQTVQKGELERLLNSQNIKHKPTDYWDDCYELNGEYLINIEDAGLMFESVESMLKFLGKTSFLKNPLNRQFVFFELVEKNELKLLMNAPPKGFKKKRKFYV